MSIPNLIDKIKSKTGIDNMTFMYLLIIVGVGISSFGLGRLSVSDRGSIKDNNMPIKELEGSTESLNTKDGNTLITQVNGGEKRYVASKNGKMYYSLGCSGAKRIKPENEVWFGSKEEAEKSGYSLSSTCK